MHRTQEFVDIEEMIAVLRALAVLSIPFTLRSRSQHVEGDQSALMEVWEVEAQMDQSVFDPQYQR